MSLQLNTILSKITEVEDRQSLKFQSDQVSTQLQYIKNQELGISSTKEIQLAILLQHLNLSKFSNSELIFLSNLKMEYFGTRAFPLHPTKVLSKQKSFHDTGSSRLYSLIANEDLISANINLTFAGINSYQIVSLKDLIASLYLLGA
jgi:hypothetical protein